MKEHEDQTGSEMDVLVDASESGDAMGPGVTSTVTGTVTGAGGIMAGAVGYSSSPKSAVDGLLPAASCKGLAGDDGGGSDSETLSQEVPLVQAGSVPGTAQVEGEHEESAHGCNKSGSPDSFADHCQRMQGENVKFLRNQQAVAKVRFLERAELLVEEAQQEVAACAAPLSDEIISALSAEELRQAHESQKCLRQEADSKLAAAVLHRDQVKVRAQAISDAWEEEMDRHFQDRPRLGRKMLRDVLRVLPTLALADPRERHAVELQCLNEGIDTKAIHQQIGLLEPKDIKQLSNAALELHAARQRTTVGLPSSGKAAAKLDEAMCAVFAFVPAPHPGASPAWNARLTQPVAPVRGKGALSKAARVHMDKKRDQVLERLSVQVLLAITAEGSSGPVASAVKDGLRVCPAPDSALASRKVWVRRADVHALVGSNAIGANRVVLLSAPDRPAIACRLVRLRDPFEKVIVTLGATGEAVSTLSPLQLFECLRQITTLAPGDIDEVWSAWVTKVGSSGDARDLAELQRRIADLRGGGAGHGTGPGLAAAAGDAPGPQSRSYSVTLRFDAAERCPSRIAVESANDTQIAMLRLSGPGIEACNQCGLRGHLGGCTDTRTQVQPARVRLVSGSGAADTDNEAVNTPNTAAEQPPREASARTAPSVREVASTAGMAMSAAGATDGEGYTKQQKKRPRQAALQRAQQRQKLADGGVGRPQPAPVQSKPGAKKSGHGSKTNSSGPRKGRKQPERAPPVQLDHTQRVVAGQSAAECNFGVPSAGGQFLPTTALAPAPPPTPAPPPAPAPVSSGGKVMTAADDDMVMSNAEPQQSLQPTLAPGEEGAYPDSDVRMLESS